MTPKKFYEKMLMDKKYDSNIVESKFLKLNFDVNQDIFFRVKSAISFLSRFQEEIDLLIANKNYVSILNTATVKEERGYYEIYLCFCSTCQKNTTNLRK